MERATSCKRWKLPPSLYDPSSRAHLFNQLLIALSIFDILFIVCSVPVYSFPLFNWLEGSKVRERKKKTDIKIGGKLSLERDYGGREGKKYHKAARVENE